MFSLLGFKSLDKCGNTLVSPQQGTLWERAYVAPLGETFRLEAGESDLENGVGVFAASYWEAEFYGSDVYLVAPDPRLPVVEGENGWRARAAFVVAGPFGRSNVDEAARIIVAAYYAGYPQVEGILGWAATLTKDVALVIEYGSVEDLYIMASELPDEKYDPAILDILLASAGGDYLCELGINLQEKRWNSELATRLAEIGDASHLYRAITIWPDERFTQILSDAFLQKADAYHLYLAGRDFAPARWRPEIAEALCATGDAACLLRAAFAWPNERFTRKIISALAETDDIKRLYEAGCFLVKARWSNKIARRFAEIADAYWLERARRDWPQERRKELDV